MSYESSTKSPVVKTASAKAQNITGQKQETAAGGIAHVGSEAAVRMSPRQLNGERSPDLEATIRAQAYLLSEQAGHPAGMDKFFWFQAEQMVLGRNGASGNASAALKKAPRKAPVNKKRKLVPAPVQAGKTRRGKVLAAP